MIAKTHHHTVPTSEEEKIAHGKKVLDRMGLTESVMEEAYRNGQTAVDVMRKILAQKAQSKSRNGLPKNASLLAEKDAEIKALHDQIARLEARIVELEKPAAVA